MKQILAYFLALQFLIIGLGIFMIPQVPKTFAGTTTVTITGWLMPDSAHFANTLILLIYPLIGLVLFTVVARMFKLTGDTGVYVALLGLGAGEVFADLPSSPANTVTYVPFAIIFVTVLLAFFWWWNS